MYDRTEGIAMNLLEGRLGAGEGQTIVIEGHIGQLTDDRVVVFPLSDRRYAIEIARRDVLECHAGSTVGSSRFVLSRFARVHERITITTTARRPRSAGEVSSQSAVQAVDAGSASIEGWIRDSTWAQPD